MEEISLEHPKLLLFWIAIFPSKQWWCLQSPGLGVFWASPVPSSPLFNSSPRRSQCIVGTGGILRQNLLSAPGQLETQRSLCAKKHSFLVCTWGIGSPGEGCRRPLECVRLSQASGFALHPLSLPSPSLVLTKSCAFSLLATAPAWGRVWWSWTVFPPPKPVFPFYS